MRRPFIWILAAILSAALTVAWFLPATWMAALVEKQTLGRITLGDAQGSFWRGSAFIGGAAGGSGPVTPLFAGRFSWRISPLVLVGQVDVQIENPVALSQPVRLQGSWSQWQLSPATLLLPPERLQGLGAPLNTVGLSGQLSLTWNSLQFVRQTGKVDVLGAMQLEMRDMASRLSPVKPLGTYGLGFDWRGQTADIELKTLKGPMLLSGKGNLVDGRLHFSGQAEAEAGQEDRLANLLNLLGQRRRVGDKDVIALEFK
ncbi:type II secretion system protein N [Undibacterium sp. TJN25]|uniref:type II secretion system protein N n=1 Tax=Undibacterium sp. TJN25 TaxID=3413056 RepID=UPI003BF3AD87